MTNVHGIILDGLCMLMKIADRWWAFPLSFREGDSSAKGTAMGESSMEVRIESMHRVLDGYLDGTKR
jgi:hypothetical protein